MSFVRSLVLCVALPLSITAWAAEPVKGKESIAGKAAASPKAAKPAAKSTASTPALKATPAAAVSKPATTESALGVSPEATQSHCHSSGSDA